MKAGFANEYYGYSLLKMEAVRAEIERLKDETKKELFVNGNDLLEFYIRIAFADITDYVCFGNYEKDGEKRSYVYLKDWNEVDGQLIEEVTVNSGGGKIKLLDKGKALEKLERFFDLFGADAWKRFVEGQKRDMRDNGMNRVINVITGIVREEQEDEI